MIHAVMVINTLGLSQPVEKQQELIRSVYTCYPSLNSIWVSLNMPMWVPLNWVRLVLNYCFDVVLSSRAENVSNFLDVESIFGPDTRLVYKHFATLYFVFVFDSSENELAMLDLIQVFVETLDKCFKNVCEVDVVLNYSKLRTVLDEIVFGGQVLETSSTEVLKAVEEIARLETATNSISLVPKSVSSWRAR